MLAAPGLAVLQVRFLAVAAVLGTTERVGMQLLPRQALQDLAAAWWRPILVRLT